MVIEFGEMEKWQEVCRPVERIVDAKTDVRLELRSPQEMKVIAERALTWSCGDTDKARKLLRKVEFRMYGKTWGNDLVVGDGAGFLTGVSEVIEMVDMVARMKERQWQSWLATYAVEGIRLWPFDAPLYLAMVEDLGDKSTH